MISTILNLADIKSRGKATNCTAAQITKKDCNVRSAILPYLKMYLKAVREIVIPQCSRNRAKKCWQQLIVFQIALETLCARNT